MSQDAAVAEFKKKFKEKTKNAWEQRNKFQAQPGKYTLLEMGEEDDEEKDATDTAPQPVMFYNRPISYFTHVAKAKAYNTCISPRAAYRSYSGAVHVTELTYSL